MNTGSKLKKMVMIRRLYEKENRVPSQWVLRVKSVSQHVCEACTQMIPPTKDISGPSTKD